MDRASAHAGGDYRAKGRIICHVKTGCRGAVKIDCEGVAEIDALHRYRRAGQAVGWAETGNRRGQIKIRAAGSSVTGRHADRTRRRSRRNGRAELSKGDAAEGGADTIEFNRGGA